MVEFKQARHYILALRAAKALAASGIAENMSNKEGLPLTHIIGNLGADYHKLRDIVMKAVTVGLIERVPVFAGKTKPVVYRLTDAHTLCRNTLHNLERWGKLATDVDFKVMFALSEKEMTVKELAAATGEQTMALWWCFKRNAANLRHEGEARMGYRYGLKDAAGFEVFLRTAAKFSGDRVGNVAEAV